LHAIHRNEFLKNTPFIFLTAKTERSDFRKGMELGADDYITKPFTGTELLSAVEGRLNKIDALREEFAPGIEGVASLMQAVSGKEALQRLTQDRNINRYKKKEIIFSEGNHPANLFYILKGKVKTYKVNENGKELVTELFSPGDFLGHVALLEGTVYKDTAEALEETELAVIPRDDFNELLNKNAEATKKIIQLLAGNISGKENQLLALAYNSLRRKVADALLMLQKKYKDGSNNNYMIDLSRENLATIAGTATESLIRTLSDFREEKLIDIRNGNIVVLDEEGLEKMVN
jgi:CRP/FNR family transcriptional regulator, cyclic AMP receptor protein